VGVALFATATVAGARMGEVMGVLARKGDVRITANDQVGATGSVTIARVVAPHDSWVIVHLDGGDGMPGKRIGYAPVPAGVSTDIVVKLDTDKLTPKLLVALHVDHGTRGKLEFDMKRTEASPDKPYIVDGKEMATTFKVADFGVTAAMGAASVQAGDQPGGASVKIAKVVAPGPAWVLVHEDDNGMPGKRLGVTHVDGGESGSVEVKLDKPVRSGKLLVAVHADRGEVGKLEFDMDDKVNSPDQPFFVDGAEVAVAVTVR
jgi:hypothetical protein